MTDTLASEASHRPSQAEARGVPRTGPLLAIVLIGQFMAILDVSVVNVAAPTIRTDLGSSGAGLQLVIAGYTISYAVLLVTGARLGDLAGHRRMFQLGLALFTAASLACGLAWSTGALVGFRLLQGAGAALMVPQVLSLIQRTFGGAGRARALSIYATVIAGGAVVGQVVGGVLVSADLFGTQWRPVFLVNVPIGIALLAAGSRWLPGDRGEPGRRLDPLGVTTLSAAVLAFVVPLVLGHEQDWPLWGWVMLAASVALFGVFALVQRRVALAGGSPLVPGRLLRAPGVIPAALAIFAMMATYAGFLFSLALHLQGGLGFSALRAGLTFIPGAAGFAVVSLNWRRLPAAWHRGMVAAGLVLAAIGYAGLALVMRDGGTGGLGLLVTLGVVGVGLGAAFSPLMTRALSAVPVTDAADASGALATVVQLAQVVGVATFGTLFLSLVTEPTVVASAHAYAITALALGAVALVAAACAMLRSR